WREDMNGVNWEAVTLRWRSVAAKALTHDDLVDILWETVGELNTSHAYVIPSTGPGDQSKKLGFLGADLAKTAQGWTITRILPGESSDPDARSPLRQAGVGAQAGDVIVAVNGQPVDAAAGPAAQLQGRRTRSSSSPCAAAAARTARSPSSPWPARRRCATRTGCDHGGSTWPRSRKDASATSTFPIWPP